MQGEVRKMKDIRIDDYVSVEAFASYTEAHYLPLLERLSRPSSVMSEEDRRLLSFLHKDLTDFANNFNE